VHTPLTRSAPAGQASRGAGPAADGGEGDARLRLAQGSVHLLTPRQRRRVKREHREMLLWAAFFGC
jgi:hypothetical protein